MTLRKWYRVGKGDLALTLILPPSFTIELHFGIALLRYEVSLYLIWFGISYNWER